jgi:hypothetical protein
MQGAGEDVVGREGWGVEGVRENGVREVACD